MKNKELAEKLHNLIIRKFEKLKVHLSFINSIWSADLADVQLLNKFNKRIRFLLSVIDIYSKCVWVIPLKDRKGIINTIVNPIVNTIINPRWMRTKTKQNMDKQRQQIL